jgi:hypothetical protein
MVVSDLGHHSEIRPPEYLADAARLPSGAAVAWVIQNTMPSFVPDHRIDVYVGSCDCPDECCYIAPIDPSQDGTCSSWCMCTDCYDDNHIDEADQVMAPNPDDDWDDQSEPDGWEGMDAMPDIARGRCRFGIEIEFNGSDYIRRDMIPVLQRNGFPVMDLGYTHEVTRCWKMTTDATVSGGELVSPVLSGDDTSIEMVREAIRLLKQNGATTDRNVGMHVHLDATHLRRGQLRVMAANMRATERLFASFVPDHRIDGSQSCGGDLIPESTWDEIERWIRTVNVANRMRSRDNRNYSCPASRSSSWNFNSLLTYGSVECRLLGHTLNTIKVRTWIRALQTLMSASRRQHTAPPGSDGLEWLVEMGLEQEHADRFRKISEGRGNASDLILAA